MRSRPAQEPHDRVEYGERMRRAARYVEVYRYELAGPVVRLGFALVRLLDAWNLLPGFFMANDPLYASLFLANLGSAGVSDGSRRTGGRVSRSSTRAR